MKKLNFLSITLAVSLLITVGFGACAHEHALTEVSATPSTCTVQGNLAQVAA